MKYILTGVLTFLMIAGQILVGVAGEADTHSVQSIKFTEEEGEAATIVVKLSQQVEPVFFRLQGEKPRLVFDFPDTTFNPGQVKPIETKGSLVKKIRIGFHRSPQMKTRLVIDLQSNGDLRVMHMFQENQATLRITISSDPDPESKPKVPSGEKQESTIEKQKAEKPGAENVLSQEAAPQSDEVADTVIQQNSEDDSVPPEQTEESAPVTLQDDVSIFEQNPEGLETGKDRTIGITDEDIPVLLKVSFERSTNDKEMILFTLSGFHPPVVFSTEDDDLLVVCDFFDAILGYGVGEKVEADGSYINSVFISKHTNPQKVRVVIDLKENYTYDLKQVFFKEDNLFVIIISNMGEKETS